MNQLPNISRSLGVAALVFLSGCSWFSHKPSAEDASATAASDPAVLATDPATPADTDASAQAAAKLAEDFYEMHQRLASRGLPDSGSENAYNAFLCPRLVTLMVNARQRQQKFITEHPDEKPPFIEGDLFSSLFEGTESAKARETTVDGDQAMVSVAMRHGDGEKASKWNDTVVLMRIDDIWCIEDVEYQGDWPFANKGTLSDTLRADL